MNVALCVDRRALPLEEPGEAPANALGAVVGWPKGVLAYAQSTRSKLPGFCVLLLFEMQLCQAGQGGRCIRILGTERLFANREGALEEGRCFCVLALRNVDFRQVIKGKGDLMMLGPKRLFSDLKHAQKERLSLALVSLQIVGFRQILQREGDLRMLRPERLFSDLLGAYQQWLSFCVLT